MSDRILYPTKDELEQILKENSLVLVDFFATWCMPCTMLAPIIEEIAEEYKGKVTVCKVDIDKEEALATQYQIQTIPTVILFKKSVPTEPLIGLNDRSIYDDMIFKNS